MGPFMKFSPNGLTLSRETENNSTGKKAMEFA